MENIVVGVDFSAESTVAAEQAVQLARRAGATVTLVHAAGVPDFATGAQNPLKTALSAYQRILEERMTADREALNALRTRLSGQGATVSQMVIEGFPDTGVTTAAEELAADLVVVGSHGRTGVKRFLLGSVAERVVRLFPGNVMVARRRSSNAGFSQILVPTDLSTLTTELLDTALSIAAPGASITLLHCWHLPPFGVAQAPKKFLDEARLQVSTEVTAQAAKLVESRSSESARVTFVDLERPATLGIQDWLDDNECDLVVMGSHGRRGLRRLILGSVAEVTVRHAKCSVMVVHNRG